RHDSRAVPVGYEGAPKKGLVWLRRSVAPGVQTNSQRVRSLQLYQIAGNFSLLEHCIGPPAEEAAAAKPFAFYGPGFEFTTFPGRIGGAWAERHNVKKAIAEE